MRSIRSTLGFIASSFLLASLPVRVSAGSILQTDGFTSCQSDADVQVHSMNIQFDKNTGIVDFDVSGTSTKVQNVTAKLSVSAYGKDVYDNTFDPCDQDSYVKQLCPVPAGTFSAVGSQKIPDQYISMIPSIAYNIPDLDGLGKLELISKSTNSSIACIQSSVTNNKTAEVPAVKYVAAGIAGGALVVSGLSALASGSGGHGASTSPTFMETMMWFQGMAMNGMLSVDYPPVYRSFTRNFGFSTGLIPWGSMQKSIDSFRAATGGNLTNNSYEYLQNTTLVYTSGSGSDDSLASRSLGLFARAVETSVNGTSGTVGEGSTGNANATAAPPKNQDFVSGIQGYAEELTIPSANTFMTVLLIFAIVLAAITASILLFKVILEAWALTGSFPKSLVSFRKNYWWLLAKTITNLILLLYGVWVLYCIYQFKDGDSWAAKLLAGITLFAFTAILLGFTWRIYYKASQFKKAQGNANGLYTDKPTWVRYSIFYDNYKRSYWWVFVPAIIYMFAKGCVIAGASGHGLPQVAGQLIVESLFVVLLIIIRPYERTSNNWINIVIQVVRVLSVVVILVFVEELGVSQTTKTITGVVLIVVQAVLTGVLAILIAVNSIVNCIRMNPHRRRRKEAAQFNRDLDDLTPLDARNSLLMYPSDKKQFPSSEEKLNQSFHSRGRSKEGYDPVATRDITPSREARLPSIAPHYRNESNISINTGRNTPDSMHAQRQPQLPDLEYRGLAI